MTSSNRRAFLERSMFLTAASLATAYRLNAQEPSDDANSPKVGPNDTIRVAVIGAGGRGQSHVAGFAGKPGTEVTHICDCDEKAGQNTCEAAAERQGDRKPKWVKDIRQLLEDPSIDAVSIATPNHWHSLGAIWAIQAGKDVYVEKPVSHNVLEGRRLVQMARKHNRIVQTGTQCRSNPGMRAAMSFIHSGKIGDVKVARGLCYKRRDSIGPKGNYHVPNEVDYDLWSGPAQILPVTRKRFHYDWHWQWPYGNGDLGNQGIHQMDLCRWALNENRLCERTFSIGARLGYQDAGETANTQIAVHDYGDKQLVFEVRGLPTPNYKGAMVGIIIEATQGYLVMTSYDNGTAFDLEGNVIRQFSGGDDAHHYRNFQEAVRRRDYKHLHADVEEGHLSSALCHLANISMRLGEPVREPSIPSALSSIQGPGDMTECWNRTLEHLHENGVKGFEMQVGPQLDFDPISESFKGNASANAMLTREYRAGYELPSEPAV